MTAPDQDFHGILPFDVGPQLPRPPRRVRNDGREWVPAEDYDTLRASAEAIIEERGTWISAHLGLAEAAANTYVFAEARVRLLEEALRPFAEAAEEFPPKGWWPERPESGWGDEREVDGFVTVGHLRAARRVLLARMGGEHDRRAD